MNPYLLSFHQLLLAVGIIVPISVALLGALGTAMRFIYKRLTKGAGKNVENIA